MASGKAATMNRRRVRRQLKKEFKTLKPEALTIKRIILRETGARCKPQEDEVPE